MTLRQGRHKSPHNHREMATNNHQLMPMLLHCSNLSRWRQPPTVIRNPQPQRSPSATRCNHSSKCTRNHSQSHYDDESMIEMSGRCLLRLTRMLGMSKYQESEPQVDTFLFMEPQDSKSHWALSSRLDMPQCPVTYSRPRFPFEPEPLDLNGHLPIARAVKR